MVNGRWWVARQPGGGVDVQVEKLGSLASQTLYLITVLENGLGTCQVLVDWCNVRNQAAVEVRSQGFTYKV